MKRLREFSLEELGGGLNAVDLGASGAVKKEWQPIAHWMNVVGFDPNAAECERLNAKSSGYHSVKFLPYALAGETGPHTLYKTKSPFCWSLLKPRLDDWLSRFTYSDLFEPTGTETIMAYRLDEVRELAGVDMDAMKVDTQGLELAILQSAPLLVDACVSIETETGFTQNYEGETTFDQILAFMNTHGFGLFGIDPNHAVTRKNRLGAASRNEQLLWCEATWLRDYYKSSADEQKKLTRAKALKALCLYANHGCLSFGLEAAALFRDLGLITGVEYDAMARDKSWWELPGQGGALRGTLHSAVNYMPRKVVGRIRSRLASFVGLLDNVSLTPHPLKRK